MFKTILAWLKSLLDHLAHIHPSVDPVEEPPVIPEPTTSPVDIGAQGPGVGPADSIGGQSVNIDDVLDDDGNPL